MGQILRPTPNGRDTGLLLKRQNLGFVRVARRFSRRRAIPGQVRSWIRTSPARRLTSSVVVRARRTASRNTSNPILKPWAKQLMDIANERVAAGGIPFVDDSRCWLGGVPSILLFPGEAVVFLQTPKEVWILSKRDAEVRRIYMNVPHSKNPGYSWTGESVGHYENGDTLVVRYGGAGRSGPPRSLSHAPTPSMLRVVERYHLNNGGKGIEITFTVDDPGAFTMPWKGKVDFKAGIPPRSDHWEEDICADNGDGYGFATRSARSDAARRQSGFLGRDKLRRALLNVRF